ncbi:MAG: hypothetical protein GX410_06745 [Elusimicrobia bacterium]|nr:hypothetical protein [Elusimicrobiota bacterium]
MRYLWPVPYILSTLIFVYGTLYLRQIDGMNSYLLLQSFSFNCFIYLFSKSIMWDNIKPIYELIILFGPGTLSGFIIGYFLINNSLKLWKSLIPLLLAYFALIGYLGVMGIWFFPYFFLVAPGGVYALLGALIGWQIRRRFRGKHITKVNVLLWFCLVGLCPAQARAWGPYIGHKNIISSANELLRLENGENGDRHHLFER